MPPMPNSSASQLVEGHLLQPHASPDERSACAVCDESGHDADVMLRCAGCPLVSHARCASEVSVVCANAFRPDQVRAAFVRCFASLLYTYRRHLCIADHKQRRNGLLYSFNSEGFLRSLPSDCTEFVGVLLNTQCESCPLCRLTEVLTGQASTSSSTSARCRSTTSPRCASSTR
jgi:hypothetical protein